MTAAGTTNLKCSVCNNTKVESLANDSSAMKMT